MLRRRRAARHSDVTRALYKSVAEQLEIFEKARINLRDAVQRVDADVQNLRLAAAKRGE